MDTCPRETVGDDSFTSDASEEVDPRDGAVTGGWARGLLGDLGECGGGDGDSTAKSAAGSCDSDRGDGLWKGRAVLGVFGIVDDWCAAEDETEDTICAWSDFKLLANTGGDVIRTGSFPSCPLNMY